MPPYPGEQLDHSRQSARGDEVPTGDERQRPFEPSDGEMLQRIEF
jgi:hypothetical protein